MTVSLGGIILDDDLRLDGLHSSAGIAGSARVTMGGIVFQTMPMSSGKTLSLIATSDGDAVKGLFTQAQLDSLVALRDAGAPISLVHHLFTGLVFLTPESIAVDQVMDYANPAADAWYVGTITMITVE